MKVLLVDAHNLSYLGRAQYREEVAVIREVFAQHNAVEPGGNRIVERRFTNLRDHIFELIDHEYPDQRGASNFRCVDMVVVIGNAAEAPWSQACRQLCVLLKMCVLTNKSAFVTGLGFSTLCYVLATGAQRLKVLGFLPASGRIDPAVRTDISERSLRGTEEKYALLEPTTGDFYICDDEDEQHPWKPQGNVGLLHHESNLRSKFKTTRFEAAAPNYDKPVAEIGETVVNVRLRHLRHPLLQGTQLHGFRAPFTSHWVVNEMALQVTKYSFEVLADGAEGPVLAMCGSLLAFQGRISRKHASTARLFRNYVHSMATRMKDDPQVPTVDFLLRGISNLQDTKTFNYLVQNEVPTAQRQDEDKNLVLPVGLRRPERPVPNTQGGRNAVTAKPERPRRKKANLVAAATCVDPVPVEKVKREWRRKPLRQRKFASFNDVYSVSAASRSHARPPRRTYSSRSGLHQNRSVHYATDVPDRSVAGPGPGDATLGASTMYILEGQTIADNIDLLHRNWRISGQESTLAPGNDVELRSLNSEDDLSSDDEFYTAFATKTEKHRKVSKSAWAAKVSKLSGPSLRMRRNSTDTTITRVKGKSGAPYCAVKKFDAMIAAEEAEFAAK